MADLAKVLNTVKAAEDGLEFNIRTLDGDELDTVVKVVGIGSEAWKKADMTYNARLDKLMRKYKHIPDTAPDDDKKLEKYVEDCLERQKEVEKLMAERAARCVVSWRNLSVNGKEIECTYENAVELFTAFPNFAVQVVESISKLKEMMGNSKASSKNSAK